MRRDLGPKQIEVESAVELSPKFLFWPLTHRVLLSNWPEILELQGETARIIPSRTPHLGNPGLMLRPEALKSMFHTIPRKVAPLVLSGTTTRSPSPSW